MTTGLFTSIVSNKLTIVRSLLLASIIFVIDVRLQRGISIGVLYVSTILVSLWSSNKSVTYFSAFFCSILLILGFELSPHGETEFWISIANRFLALFAVWITTLLATQRIEMSERKEQAQIERLNALEQLKILRGMLPICASCKKIRDDKGYWNQIESYIKEHSEADFSHSLCPECQEKVYEELDSIKKFKSLP